MAECEQIERYVAGLCECAGVWDMLSVKTAKLSVYFTAINGFPL